MRKILFRIIGVFFIICILSLFVTFRNYEKYINNIVLFELDTFIELDNRDNDINWDVSPLKYIQLDNEVVEICSSGVYHLTGSIDDGYIIIGTVGDVKLILDNVNINNDAGPSIIVNSASKVIIELNDDSVNNLSDGLNYDNLLYDGCIFSKSDLIFEGSGTLNVIGNYKDGIVCNGDLKFNDGIYNINAYDDAIRGKDSIYIIDGDFNINSNGDGFKTSNILENNKGFIYVKNGNFNINGYGDGFDAVNSLIIENGVFEINTRFKKGDNSSKKGIKADGNVIIKNGTFRIDVYDDAIKTNGNMLIKNGCFEIKNADDGIKVLNNLIIEDCDLFIENAYEGIEAGDITIMDGSYNIVVQDDGINVKRDDNDDKTKERLMVLGDLTIENGHFVIEAESDGIDVNGNITINGGTILIDSSSIFNETAVDYNGFCNINGGILIAISGHNALAQGASETSSQYSLMYYLTKGYSSSKLIIEDENGHEIISYDAKKEYRNVFVSSKEIMNGSSYSLIIDNKKVSIIEVDSVFNDDYDKEKKKEILER